MIGLAEDGTTILCVTHEMGFARTVADRVIFMDKGEIVEEAETRDLLPTPSRSAPSCSSARFSTTGGAVGIDQSPAVFRSGLLSYRRTCRRCRGPYIRPRSSMASITMPVPTAISRMSAPTRT